MKHISEPPIFVFPRAAAKRAPALMPEELNSLNSDSHSPSLARLGAAAGSARSLSRCHLTVRTQQRRMLVLWVLISVTAMLVKRGPAVVLKVVKPNVTPPNRFELLTRVG